MDLSRIIQTKTQRFFLVLLVILLGGAGISAWVTGKFIMPTNWYFYTTDGTQIDIQSPNRKMIIDMDFYSREKVGSDEQRLRMLRRCDWTRRSNQSASPIGATYRGVELCNTIEANGEDMDIRHSYFKERVDRLYQEYYGEWVAHLLRYFGSALGVWLTSILAWRTVKWIGRGTSA